SLPTFDSLENWYPELEKPSFSPPGWVVGPVWTLLYAMMGTSMYIASRHGDENAGAWRASRILFGTQLALNVLWSWVFFGGRAPGWALVEIVFLGVAVVAAIVAFSRVSGKAAVLLVPYLLWVTFAAVLNGAIWDFNK
ncbi:MAG: TspO/MBR family protein, partial [Rubrobacteraceae bacterium]